MNRRHLLRNALGLGLLGCPICAASVSRASADDHAPHWSYEGHGGPEEWGELASDFKTCSVGRQQSPINIVKPISAKLDPVKTAWIPMTGTVVHNGHTIQVNPQPGSKAMVGSESYDLLQFHFHHPSEHLLNGRAFPMEVHFVHKGADGLAVIGVFMAEGAANKAIEKIWSVMPTAAGEVKLDEPLDANGMLPKAMQNFQYAGSLTTPPCSEVVSWIVARQPITVSAEQIEKFAKIFPVNGRPIQPINRRKILAGG